MFLRNRALNLLLVSIFAATQLVSVGRSAQAAVTVESFNKQLDVGVNLGNALEAPKEGEWGLRIEPDYLKLIAGAGFKNVRIPIRWSAHASDQPPYTVDPMFMSRVKEVVKQATDNRLLVIINMHHYEELESAPEKERARFLAIWKQISDEFKGAPASSLAFEIYNEPCKSMTDDFWNALFAETLAQVRKTNRDRFVVVGPTGWNNAHKLSTLKLPEQDKNLIVTVHYYYDPFHFTHQGASWVGKESEQWLGTKWLGTDAEVGQIKSDFDGVLKWGVEHHRPIYLGEFGSYSKADMESRVRWTKAVRSEAIRHAFSCAYWEFGSGFGVYDPQAHTWRKPLLEALTGK